MKTKFYYRELVCLVFLLLALSSKLAFAQSGGQALSGLFSDYQRWAGEKTISDIFPGGTSSHAQRSYETSFKFDAFDLKVWRNVYPDLLTKQGWIVDDQVSFYFKAEAVAKLFEQELILRGINLGSLNGDAAAKISIEKRFHSYHFHATKEEAYTSDLRYLLTPFWFLTADGLQELKAGDNIVSEDWILVDGQGKLHWSGPYGISGDVSANASFYRASKREVAFEQHLLPSLRLGLEVEKRVGLSFEASLGLELYKCIQLSLLHLGLSYSYNSSLKSHYLLPYDQRFSSWQNLSNHAATILRGEELAGYDEFLVAQEMAQTHAFKFDFTFLIFHFGASESTEEKNIYLPAENSTYDVAQVHQRFYRHDARSEFKVNSFLSLFEGSLFGLLDFLYTAFRGVPYYTEKNSGIEYKFEENLLKKDIPYSLVKEQAFRSHRSYTHLVQRKGLWKWLSKLKLKHLFAEYQLIQTPQGDWRQALKNAQTPWRFENQLTLGLPGMMNFLSRDYQQHKQNLTLACQVNVCSESDYDLLLDSLQEAWSIFSHRAVSALERDQCNQEVDAYLKGKSLWYKIRHKMNLRRACVEKVSFLSPSERLKYLDVKTFYHFWRELGGDFKGNQGLVTFFGPENVFYQTRFIYQLNNFPAMLEIRSDTRLILRPSDESLLKNGLRAPASLMSTSSEF